MHDTPNDLPMIDWVRARFGIEDEEELRAVLADPSEMLALLDVARANGEDGLPIAGPDRSRSAQP